MTTLRELEDGALFSNAHPIGGNPAAVPYHYQPGDVKIERTIEIVEEMIEQIHKAAQSEEERP